MQVSPKKDRIHIPEDGEIIELLNYRTIEL